LSPFLVLAVLTVVSGLAAAETAGSVLREGSADVSPGWADEPAPGIKSGTTALLWSLFGTMVPVVTGSLYRNDENSNLTGAVLAGGVIIGPSLGHFYSARAGRGLFGIGIRTLAGAAVAAAAVEIADDGNNYDLEVLGVVGLIVGTASLVWDIASAPHSAHVHNHQLSRRHASLGITPSFNSAGLGLRAAVSF
jgi:hypothetical protein